MRRHELSDDQWAKLEAVLDRSRPGPKPKIGDRQFINAVEQLRSPVDELAGKKDGGAVLRTYGTGSQIVSDLGVTRMRVLSAPKQMHAISGFGLEVVDYIEK